LTTKIEVFIKVNFLLGLVLLLSALAPISEVYAQKGKGLVFNGIDQFVQFPATRFPTGASARTLEFWMKTVPGEEGIQHSILNYGDASGKGSVFGVYGNYDNGKYYLGFWGQDESFERVTEIPDSDWHFVALTYDGTSLGFYLDGALRLMKPLSLSTNSGPVYLGRRKNDPNFFKGAVRDITIWGSARSQGQIQTDMVPWPTISGKERSLVAHLPLNEGGGNTFSSLNGAISGMINGKATWSKPIANNPDPIDEGIWFVIQNKADVDADTSIPPRRMAMKAVGNQITWSAIPIRGDYDAFLWRVLQMGSHKYLINKEQGMDKAMDSGKQYATMQSFGNYSGQHWVITQANLEKWGTNVYTLTNNFVAQSAALSLEGSEIRFVSREASNANQGWVLQPMEAALGYHIPVSRSAHGPLSQELRMNYNFKVYASNTVAEWSVLNGHLIWKNMLNSVHNPDAIAQLNGQRFTRKELQIISRFDQNTIVAQYPLNTSRNQIIFDEEWFTNYRGGSGNDPQRQLSSTTITQEMMCRKGTFSRGYKDRAEREFHQTVHEFAHALDMICGMNGSGFPDPTLGGSRREAIAAAVQGWFNNNGYASFASTRARQKTEQPAHFNHLKTFYLESNSWMPPRWLRDQPNGRVQLNNGDVLEEGEWIYSTTPYNPNGTYASLQEDGNFVVRSNENNGFRWGTYNMLNVPLHQVKSLTMENGVLRMKDAGGNNVYSSSNSTNPSARLVIAEPLPGKPNSWMRIVDGSGRVVWTP
jgi:hypothetical protein